MAISTVGYTGTVDEAAIAQIMLLAGKRYAVADAASFKVTAVAGSRQVIVAPGVAYAAFVKVTNTAPVPLTAWTLASGGQWHLIVLERDWSGAGSATIKAIAGPTTSTLVPTAPPSSYPAEFKSLPGVLDDQPLAWVHVTAASTAVTIIDLRPLDGPVTVEPLNSMNWSSARVRKEGPRIFVEGAVAFNTPALIPGDQLAGRLPLGARPLSDLVIDCTAMGAGFFPSYGAIRFNSDGFIYLNLTSVNSNAYYYAFNFNYVAA
jgi:hypothetical protein